MTLSLQLRQSCCKSVVRLIKPMSETSLFSYVRSGLHIQPVPQRKRTDTPCKCKTKSRSAPNRENVRTFGKADLISSLVFLALRTKRKQGSNVAMKNVAVVAAVFLLSTQARACPLSESLVERYGISFSGFKTTIPAAKAPDTTSGDPFVRVAIADDGNVSDGYRHTAVMDTKTKKVWILRTGGFLGVYEWYGPVDAIDASLENCRLEPTFAVAQGPQKR